MAINKDHSTTPTNVPVGRNPEKVPIVASMVLEQWLKTIDSSGRARADESLPWRASFASSRCDRQLYYQMTNAERATRDVADTWRMNIGTMVHAVIEQAVATIDGIEAEVVVTLPAMKGTAHADLIRQLPPDRVPGTVVPEEVIDVKTINGFGFKNLATNFAGPPQGPKHAHEVQVAVVVKARNSARGRIVYLALENLSPSQAYQAVVDDKDLGRFTAEFIISRDRCDQLADHEEKRVSRILSAIAHELLPVRALDDPEYPAGAVVVNPKTKLWNLHDGTKLVESGNTWFCDYCDFRSKCIEDGPGDQPEQLL